MLLWSTVIYFIIHWCTIAPLLFFNTLNAGSHFSGSKWLFRPVLRSTRSHYNGSKVDTHFFSFMRSYLPLSPSICLPRLSECLSRIFSGLKAKQVRNKYITDSPLRRYEWPTTIACTLLHTLLFSCSKEVPLVYRQAHVCFHWTNE